MKSREEHKKKKMQKQGKQQRASVNIAWRSAIWKKSKIFILGQNVGLVELFIKKYFKFNQIFRLRERRRSLLAEFSYFLCCTRNASGTELKTRHFESRYSHQ